MTGRSGIFAGEDPFELTKSWLDHAAATEPGDTNAMTLATADGSGLPNARIVLLKEIGPKGFVFFTNYHSVKGRELAQNAQAAIVLHWKTVGRQIRARGIVDMVASEQSDAYYHSRPLDSRIGAWASRQSQPLAAREDLVAEIQAVRSRFGDAPPRPPHWGGYRLSPVEIEFWAEAPFRLHDRFRWRRTAPGAEWQIERLNP